MMETTQNLVEIAENYDLNKQEDLMKLFDWINECIFAKDMTPKEIFQIPEDLIQKLHGVAYSLYESGKYELAYQLFQRLLLLDPKSSSYALGSAISLDKLKNYELAKNYYGYAFINDTSDPTPLFYAGQCCLKLNDPKRAREFFKHAAKISEGISAYQAIKERSLLILNGLSE